MERQEGDVVAAASEAPVGCPHECLEEDLRHDDQEESNRDDNNVVDRPSDGDLVQKIIKQVEYYFSDENLPSDKHMISLIKSNKEGFVPISVIASFRKMKKLTKDLLVIVEALKGSPILVVSSDEKNVKRLQPFPLNDVKKSQLCTVVVENLPEDHSVENIRKMFHSAGRIKNISIRDPNSKKWKNTETPITCKLHALVEYDTVEAAENAVATLNDEGDWRNGLRVKLLKRMLGGKHGNKKQNRREVGPEKGVAVGGTENKHKPNDLSEAMLDLEGQGQTSIEKKDQPNRNRVRTKKNKYGSGSGMGHGTAPSTQITEPLKPPPGPKMPDGTKGFAMGRGRTPISLS